MRHQFTTLFDYGVFDRFPRLKVLVLESGGGWIGYWLDRIDAVYGHTFIGTGCRWSTSRATTSASGCWITCDPDERTIPALAERFGADRFLWASDFPHADHTPEYILDLDELAGLFPDEGRRKFLGDNARELFKRGAGPCWIRSPSPTTRSGRSSPRPRSRRCCPRSPTPPATCRCCATTCARPAAASPCPRAGSPTSSRPRPASSPSRRSSASATAAAGRRRRPPTTTCCGSWSSPSAGPTWPTTSRCSRRSWPLRGEDRRAPGWHKDDVAPDADFRVAVIGAGMSGLLAAHRLQQAGVAFVILEKNDDVGGTWFENSYPGCRVDNPNHNYSYSFAQRHDWPLHFSTQDVLHGYFRDCADEFGLREHIRFGTEVESATWSDDDLRWTVRPAPRRRRRRRLVVDAVISAVGQLNRPSCPDIPGAARSRGRRSTRPAGDHDVDLAGKRVAVIGTGASAVQFIPEIAQRWSASCSCSSARRRGWRRPPSTTTPSQPGCAGSTATCPRTASGTASASSGGWATGARRRDRRPRRGTGRRRARSARSTSSAPDADRVHRGRVRRPARPARATSCPTTRRAPSGCLRDNGVWAGALKRDNVDWSPTPIREITPAGIVTVDGVESTRST